MADAKKPSVEDILAACRQMDGEGGGAAPPAAEAPAEQESAPKESSPASSPAEKAPAAGKKPGEMSVADMMAAARAEKSEDSPAGAESAADDAAEEPAAEESSAPAAPAKKASAMSVEEMMAAARGEKSAAKPAKKAAAKPKAAAAKPKAAPATAKAEAAKPSGPKETASILAAARGAHKPGPMSKAEAAKSGHPVAEKPFKPAKAPVVAPPMPKKPEYAKPKEKKAAKATTDRRGFMSTAFDYALGTPLAIGFSTLAVTNLLWVLGLARFMFPNILTEPPTQFKVGFPSEYAPGMVQTKFKAEFGVWIVRYEYEGTPEIYALKSVCTHLGCTPNWLEAEQKFKCPCHGSGFYKDGINFEGPAPRPLERYAISKSGDGQLEVDKSRTFQEEMGQWADPASYVNA